MPNKNLMKIVLNCAILKWEYGSDFKLDVTQEEFLKNPEKVYEVPDTPFWKNELSLREARYRIWTPKEVTIPVSVPVEDEPKPKTKKGKL